MTATFWTATLGKDTEEEDESVSSRPSGDRGGGGGGARAFFPLDGRRMMRRKEEEEKGLDVRTDARGETRRFGREEERDSVSDARM